MIEIIAQGIGFLALFIAFFAFKETDDKRLLIYLALCSAVWSLHFGLLGLVAAAGINAFDIAKNIIGLKYKKNIYWIGFFIGVYIIIGIVSFHYTAELFSFLPTITSVLGTIGVFYFNGVRLRLLLIMTLIIWFIYNFIGGSLPGMVSDIALIGASLYGIYKIKTKG